jgi:hypothetical protein
MLIVINRSRAIRIYEVDGSNCHLIAIGKEIPSFQLTKNHWNNGKTVGPTGFEPVTSRTLSECATKLRYGPKRISVYRETASNR